MKKSSFIVALVVVVAASLIAFRLTANKKTIDAQKALPTTNNNTPIPVTVSRVAEGEVSQQLIKTGNLVPFKEAAITAMTAGRVTNVNFELGSQVSQGAVLVQLDNKLKELSLESTQLTINKLKKDVDRYTTLLAGNATTEIQVNEVKFNYENALNQAEQIKKQIADAAVKAPISGRIVKKDIEPGEFVGAGTVVGTILDVARLKVDVQVNESDVYQLKVGQVVKVTTDIFPDKVLAGKVSYIAPQGSNEHNYPVEITIANPSGLKAGTFVNVDFSQKSNQRALLIPRLALVESLKNPYVYVVNNNVAHQRIIKVGRELGDNIEVLSGLETGDVVVVTGQLNLSEGRNVQITK